MFITSAGLTRLLGTLSIGCISLCSGMALAGGGSDSKVRAVQVAGSGTDLLNGAIVHSKKETSTGIIEKSTETVELKGDLIGRVRKANHSRAGEEDRSRRAGASPLTVQTCNGRSGPRPSGLLSWQPGALGC
jgi:hypothetical protein